MDAFDADVLIYAAVPGHPLGSRVLALLARDSETADAVGSTLLLPELLSKPLREGAQAQLRSLAAILARLELRPLDEATAQLAVALGGAHGLRAPDATHLATAVAAGADRFLTNNRRDFSASIPEIAITHPDELPPTR
jgi:predicted nucleic acid-binding protein